MRALRHVETLRAFLFSLLHKHTRGAVVMAVDENDSILLVRNSYGRNIWRFPGGGARPSEDFVAAGLREIKEELGVELLNEGTAELFGVYEKQIGHWRDEVGLVIIRGWKMTPKRSLEISEWRAFSLDALPRNVSASVRQRIDEVKGRSPRTPTW